MSHDGILQLSGLAGEETEERASFEIPLVSVSWHFEAPAGRPPVDEGSLHTLAPTFVVVKYFDKFSPKLLHLCRSERTIEKATVSLRRGGGDREMESMRAEFAEVQVSSIDAGWQSSGDQMMVVETVSFAYRRVDLTYFEQNYDGTLLGTIKGHWDFGANRGG